MANTTRFSALERVLSVLLTSNPTPVSFCSTLAVLALTFYLLYKFIRNLRGHENEKAEQEAQPQEAPLPPLLLKPWPFLGSLPQMLKNKPTFRWLHELMKRIDHAGIACLRPVSMSTDVTTKGFLTTALVPLGDQWEKMKKVLVKELLSPTRHKWLTDKRVEEADHLVRYVYNQCKASVDGALVDVRLAAQQYRGNVPRKLIFNTRFFGKGKEDGGPGVEEEEYVAALFTILSHLYSFCISDYIPWLRGIDIDGHEKVMDKVLGIVGKYQDPLIDERIQQWRHGIKKNAEDLLDILVSLKDNDGKPLLTADEIKAQITEFMIATVDNPSNAVEWALAEMLNQPEILKKATEEIDKVVGRGRLVEEADFARLNYVKACAREAFRLHPIAPFNVPHVSVADTKVANYFIPKGSHLLLSRVALGRNPKVWDDPLTFKPERHLKEDGSPVALIEPELRFISFSTGMRGCKGVQLGTSMTVMLFARLLQGFSWSIPPGEEAIDLTEAENSLFLAKPLVAMAKPRLLSEVYPGN
ncbi:Cytochrome P450 [Corchorus olitorius]|uniref:Cytochrome P450 n=1 Tax=Corchorus olitorius TaxID=93759 RepID=A0A1R3K5C9_9ROSI|nr:Cytochrome P450 [Corchorus olitorius]